MENIHQAFTAITTVAIDMSYGTDGWYLTPLDACITGEAGRELMDSLTGRLTLTTNATSKTCLVPATKSKLEKVNPKLIPKPPYFIAKDRTLRR